MQSFFRKYSTEICYFLAPVISLLLIKYIAGIHFLDYIFLSNYDTTIELSYLKLYVSGITNHIFDNPLMGAPLVSGQNYWPWRNIGIGTYYFIISLFEKDIFQIYQIFYYSLFPNVIILSACGFKNLAFGKVVLICSYLIKEFNIFFKRAFLCSEVLFSFLFTIPCLIR